MLDVKVIEEISIESVTTPPSPNQAKTPTKSQSPPSPQPFVSTEIDFDVLVAAVNENAVRKRRSPAMTPTPPVGESLPLTPNHNRPILRQIDDNEETSLPSPPLPLRSTTVIGIGGTGRSSLQRHSTTSCDTPTSFVGSPVKKKRRMSSIRRL